MDQDQMIVVVTVLLVISEALALIPAFKANSVFQLIYNILHSIRGPLSIKNSSDPSDSSKPPSPPTSSSSFKL